jgi:hypothetical protein
MRNDSLSTDNVWGVGRGTPTVTVTVTSRRALGVADGVGLESKAKALRERRHLGHDSGHWAGYAVLFDELRLAGGDHTDVPLGGAGQRREGYRAVKGGQPTFVVHGQRDEIEIGDLARSK